MNRTAVACLDSVSGKIPMIVAAMADDYSTDPQRRILQREARAHIEVQRPIDYGDDPEESPYSATYIRWIEHRQSVRQRRETTCLRRGYDIEDAISNDGRQRDLDLAG